MQPNAESDRIKKSVLAAIMMMMMIMVLVLVSRPFSMPLFKGLGL